MIAKQVALHSSGHGAGISNFATLASYITATQGKAERVGAVLMTNCASGTLQAAIDEVLATQHLNTRARGDKTCHLLVSFRAGEQPPTDTLHAIEARLCEGLGFGEHQRISAVHHDTDHLHLHIAINKIHPVRLTMHEPYYSHRALATLCAGLEQAFGLAPDNHTPRKCGAENRADDMEQQSGLQSLLGWIQHNCLQALLAAPSWAALHQVLHDNGLELRVRANGFVIAAADGTQVKASTVARALSRPKLEARLGPFEPGPDRTALPTPRRRYRKLPLRLRIDTSALHARYQAERQTRGADRSAALAAARRHRDQALEDARRFNRLRRATIRLLDGKDCPKKLLYAQAHAAFLDKVNAIRQEYSQARAAIEQAGRRCSWSDWLRREAQRGDALALAALRAHPAASGLHGNVLQASGQPRPNPEPVVDGLIDGLTKRGTLIYRVGRAAVRDDGHCLQVSREATPEALQAALRLALARYGERIEVSGSPEFKSHIVLAAVSAGLPVRFLDPELERQRQALPHSASPPPSHPPPPSQETDRQSDHLLHPGLPRSGPSPDAVRAAARYIAEREANRSKIVDIPKHDFYIDQQGSFGFAGMRHVGGHPLALLMQGQTVLVKPVDDATARRLKRIALGTVLALTAEGTLTTSSARSSGNKRGRTR